MDKEIEKLKKLLIHWIDHNNSHMKSYIKWRNYAQGRELREVVENMNKVIELFEEGNTYLAKAHQLLK